MNFSSKFGSKEATSRYRVLHVIGGLIGGGAETQLKLLLGGTNKSQFTVGVAYFNEDQDYLDREGISFYPITRNSKLDFISVIKSLSHAMDEIRPDIVQLWYPEVLTIPAALMARYRGINVISTQRHRLGGCVSFSNKVRDLFGAVAHYLAHQVITNYDTDCEPEWFKKCYKARRGQIIRNAIVPCSGVRRQPFSGSLKSLRILFVGRFVVQKRLNRLLEAVAIARNLGCTIGADVYGKGNAHTENQMKELCVSLGIEDVVKFRGYSKYWQLDCSKFDVLVLPSVTEGMPNVVVEAMSLGIPVVASDIPELTCFLRKNVDACLVPPDDPELLALALIQLQQSDDELDKYQKAGYLVSSKFTLERMVDSYQDIYRYYGAISK